MVLFLKLMESGKMLQIYIFRFDASWLGGKAVILAESLEQAEQLVGIKSTDSRIHSIEVKPLVASVVYYDDGNY